VWHGKGCKQLRQVFQNGYTRFALPCDFLCVLEYVRSASFNKAAVISGDELVCTIAVKTVSGIVVVIQVDALDRLPAIAVGGAIVCKDMLPLSKRPVGLPFAIDEDLSVCAQTSEDVVDAVADLKAGLFECPGSPVRRARQAPDQRVAARREDAKAFGQDTSEPGNPLIPAALVSVPLLAHEVDARRRIGHDGVDRAVGQLPKEVARVFVDKRPPLATVEDGRCEWIIV